MYIPHNSYLKLTPRNAAEAEFEPSSAGQEHASNFFGFFFYITLGCVITFILLVVFYFWNIKKKKELPTPSPSPQPGHGCKVAPPASTAHVVDVDTGSVQLPPYTAPSLGRTMSLPTYRTTLDAEPKPNVSP